MSQFEGIWIPLVTPFRDGRLDLTAARRLASHLADSGIAGLIVCGTTGEPATLGEAEQIALLDAVIASVDGRCAVVMGVSGNDTGAVAGAARRFGEFAIAGLMVTAPYYVRPSQDGIRRHFEAVATATDKPIILYNIPYRTGVNIEVATVKALSANPQFVAIKESAGGNMPQLMALIEETPLSVWSGEDHLIFPCLCLGGRGAASAAAHIRPDLYVAMYRHVQRGELEAARALHYRLLPLIRLLFSEPNPGPVKAALALQGWIADELRLPMTPASAGCREPLRQALTALDQA
ncbi:4-hydroxy-tetrahydrodipicolinate synthase [Chitinivorax sp. PXF-14]|uniref:4-hydroxy-tetrahydrodipicolinate synthase n=1 Tax=Chitinivorax sp. PXF-14 TaxID=3230488 RepID=UPI003466C2B7